MSQDFRKILVKDDRLNVTDAVSYAVHKGGQNVTSATFNAISQTPSSITWNIQVPSEQTLIDRRVIWASTVTLKLSCTGNATNAGQLPFNYVLTDALSAFPLHQLASVITATINNNSVSVNIRDVLPAMLRFIDRRELQRFNGMTPVAPDHLAVYADGIGTLLNSLGSWANSADNDLFQRGSYSLLAISNNQPVNGVLPAFSAGYPRPLINGTTDDYYVQFNCSEPLLLSPFIFANPQSNNQAMYGVQNMNFVVNVGDASRVWRSANNTAPAGTSPATLVNNVPYTTITQASVVGFASSRLIFNFLTPHPSDLLPARNAVPFYELPRFITTPGVAVSPNTSFPPSSTLLQTSSIQLNQIPDKLIISVRVPPNNQNCGIPDAGLCISGVSINFNNQSGILASAQQQDLYRYSIENGSNQSWYEFSGYANIPDNASGVGKRLAGAGSLLVLEFGKDIQLTEDYYSAGSLGNFNLQLQLQVYNQLGYELQPEIMIICMNSGIFVNERGTSSTYTGILTKQDVLEASAQEPMFASSVKRMVGGGFMDSMKSLIGKLAHYSQHPLAKSLGKSAKEHFAQSQHPAGRMASDALKHMGYGASGGGESGGGVSGGRSRLAERLAR